MGQYFNPNNVSFQSALNSQIYVDKSGLVGFTNSILNTEQRFGQIFFGVLAENHSAFWLNIIRQFG